MTDFQERMLQATGLSRQQIDRFIRDYERSFKQGLHEARDGRPNVYAGETRNNAESMGYDDGHSEGQKELETLREHLRNAQSGITIKGV